MTSFSPAPVSKLSIVTNDRWLNEDNRLLLPARQALIGNIRIYSTYFLICVFAPLSVHHLLFVHLSVCLLIWLVIVPHNGTPPGMWSASLPRRVAIQLPQCHSCWQRWKGSNGCLKWTRLLQINDQDLLLVGNKITSHHQLNLSWMCICVRLVVSQHPNSPRVSSSN